MNELQKTELELLKKFIEVCDELELNYYLVCGSCLGAVKYNGFIPWDDDLDVALPRHDYEAFCEKAQPILGKDVFLQTYKTDRYYPNFFAKLRDTRTTYIEKSVKHLDISHGVYIDVFPLDGYPEDEKKQVGLEKFKLAYKRKMSTVFDTENASIKVRALALIEKLLHIKKDTRKLAAEAERLFSSYDVDGSAIWCNHGNWQGVKEYSPAEQYGDGVLTEFEGVRVRIPRKYDEYLTQKYGDWRADLPDEEKKGHHYYEVCDLDTPYTVYIEKFPGGKINIKNNERKDFSNGK